MAGPDPHAGFEPGWSLVRIKLVPNPRDMPNLRILLGAYLADGAYDYPSVWDAVRAFRHESTSPSVEFAQSELRELLNANQSEEALRAAADRLECGYFPPGVGMTYADFFAHIQQILSQPMHQ